MGKLKGKNHPKEAVNWLKGMMLKHAAGPVVMVGRNPRHTTICGNVVRKWEHFCTRHVAADDKDVDCVKCRAKLGLA